MAGFSPLSCQEATAVVTKLSHQPWYLIAAPPLAELRPACRMRTAYRSGDSAIVSAVELRNALRRCPPRWLRQCDRNRPKRGLVLRAEGPGRRGVPKLPIDVF